MSYGHVYVAQIAMGANDAQTVKVFQEAEAYDGPSLIIAYSQCIEAPKIPLQDYIYTESRYRMLQQAHPDTAARLLEKAQQAVNDRWHHYEQLAQLDE